LGCALALFPACTSDSRPKAASASTASSSTANDHDSGPSAGCGKSPAAAPGSSDQHLTSGGVDRVYELDVPPSYDGTKPYALVLGLHALTESYKFVWTITGFSDIASRYDVIGVEPSGRLNGDTPFWNAAPVADNYDVTFINDLLDQLESSLCVDKALVFASGMSNGAQMSSLLGCRLPDRVTAIAPVAGVEFSTPCDGAPVPIIAFHGTADPIVLYAGGGLSATAIANTNYYTGNLPPGLPAPIGVDESMRLWAHHNGCDPAFVEQRITTEVRQRTWQHCKAATELYIVDGGGHAWPGKPQPAFEAQFGHGTTDVDATALIFAFFFGH
jgi:polyhydroxybutyrate depolymerase